MRGLKWIQAHSPEEIAAVMPAEHVLGDKQLYVQAIGEQTDVFDG